MITIVDYGIGNVASLLNMCEHLGIEATAASTADQIATAQRTILPGVGAFDAAMSKLNEKGLIQALSYSAVQRKAPFLGICLGMQLLAKTSEEGNLPGLGWIDACVKKITPCADPSFKVPHIGWSHIETRKSSELFRHLGTEEKFYFVHSYHMVCHNPSDIIATIPYPDDICCAVNRGNIYGVQFHPEKSHKFGMELLKRFSTISTESGAIK